MTSTTSTTTTIEFLPVELLLQIFSFVDNSSPAPSDHRLHDQPSGDLLRQPDAPTLQPLKSISLVSSTWRSTVLPLLFRNVVWYVDRLDLDLAQAQAQAAAIPLLVYLRDTRLSPYVQSVTLVVSDKTSSRNRNRNRNNSRRGEVDVGLYRRGDGSGQYGYSPDPLSPLQRAFVAVGNAEKNMSFHGDCNWIWHSVLGALNPLRFTIIASPRMLASLLQRMLYLGDEWSFDQTHHILSLSTDSSNTTPPSPAPAPGPSTSHRHCDLFTLRPWTRVLLNEGSSTRVYKTYEYYHKRPPSILPALVGSDAPPNDVPLLPPSIRDLSYVAIFPLANHLHGSLVSHLPCALDRLFVQVVPRNGILRDRSAMEHLDMDDLWAERNTVYADILPRLVGDMGEDSSGDEGDAVDQWQGGQGDNWSSLRVFESGDAADRESWDMAVDYVTAPRGTGAGAGERPRWTVRREGLFVRTIVN